MKCKNCDAINEKDRRVCSRCGANLQAPARELSREEHIKIGELIYAAYKQKEAGAIDDAIMACQGALALNDASAAAHVLLATLYEEKGDVASAIYEYERAIQLEPGNVNNRRKLENLRNDPLSRFRAMSTSEVTWVDKVIPYTPHAAFGIVLVAVLLVFTLVFGKGEPGMQDADADGRIVPHMTAPIQPHAQQQTPTQPFPPMGYGQPPTQPDQLAQTPPPTSPQPAQPADEERSRPAQPSPEPREEERPRPIRPPEPRERPVQEERPVMVPVIEETPRQPPPPAPSTTPPIRIEVTSPPAQPAADAEPRAMRLQSEGRHREAISAYREALAGTNDPGRIHQQMGASYRQLGEHQNAIDSYTRAISAYREQLDAGHDPADIQRKIRACEAGIEVSRQAIR